MAEAELGTTRFAVLIDFSFGKGGWGGGGGLKKEGGGGGENIGLKLEGRKKKIKKGIRKEKPGKLFLLFRERLRGWIK